MAKEEERKEVKKKPNTEFRNGETSRYNPKPSSKPKRPGQN
jgi:hypothetical protein